MDEPVTLADILPQVLEYEGPDRIVSSMEFVQLKKPTTDKLQLKTQIPHLDSAYKGFQPGEVTVISGPTGMGKTLLCDTFIRAFRQNKYFSLMFSFEVTPETVALEHNSPDSVVFLPLEHVPMDLEWIRWRCLEAKMKYQCVAVFIDHLHYVIDMATRNNMSLEIGRVMRFLKSEIALKANLAVFIICHVNKLDFATEPSIHHLRDSSFVGQEADNVMMIWRRHDVDAFGNNTDALMQGLATVKVLKARRSGVMGEKINLVKKGHILVEQT